jgi:acyl-CoA dehydrogenase
MKFNLNDEQGLLRDSVRRFVDKEYDLAARTARLRSGEPCHAGHWQTFADNGWLAAALPEAAGGLGGNVIDMALISAEFGRGLVIEPWLGSAVLAPQTVLAGGSAQQREALLPAVADGSRRLALAYSESQSRGFIGPVLTRATPAPGGYTLHGTKTLVLGGRDADAFVVSADVAGAGTSLFVVEAGQEGVKRRSLPLHDGSWAAEVTFDGVFVPADALLGEAGNGEAALRQGLAHGIAALCAELVGAMEKAIEITADYLKVRKQFGVAIGSFQSLQHRMSDMAAEMEVARSMLYVLLAAVDNDSPDLDRTVSQAKSLVVRAARYVCGQAIQLHGGIGMTEEYPVGHYFKRAVVADALFGNADMHDARNAEAWQASLTEKEEQA